MNSTLTARVVFGKLFTAVRNVSFRRKILNSASRGSFKQVLHVCVLMNKFRELKNHDGATQMYIQLLKLMNVVRPNLYPFHQWPRTYAPRMSEYNLN